MQGRAQQFNGREGETATFFSRCLLTFGLRAASFALRQLGCWTSLLEK